MTKTRKDTEARDGSSAETQFQFDEKPTVVKTVLDLDAVQNLMASKPVTPDDKELRDRALEELGNRERKRLAERDALVRSGVTLAQIENAKPPQKYIWNANIKSLSAQIGDFTPVEDNVFLYTPSADMLPITSENRHVHIALCEQRVNTVRVDNRPRSDDSWPSNATQSGTTVQGVRPMNAEQAMTISQGML